MQFARNKKTVIMASLSALMGLFVMFLITMAISIGFVSLVTSLMSIQDLFLLLFTFILGVFFPKLLNEEINTKVIITKVVAVTILFTGIVLIIL